MNRSSCLGHIDQYELLRELGGGGFGCVYLARDTVSDVDVAVKGLPPIVRNNQDELENIRRNFALVSRLHHPNIAAALTLHPASDVVYNAKADADKLRVGNGDTLVVMQYAPGVTLSKWAKRFQGGIVPLEKAIEITSAIAHALDYAHAEKILHRDVKPENVMIDDGNDGQVSVRVLDFGLAAEIHSSMSRVSNDVSDTSGTRPYMAPEQWLGSSQGHQTDQYSLAVLFYELVTGKVPFASAFETGDPIVMFGAVSQKVPDIPSWLPRVVKQALAKALSKKKASRFDSCSEFVDALRNGVRAKLSARLIAAGVVACAMLVASAVAYRVKHGRIGDDASLRPSAGLASASVSASVPDPVPEVAPTLTPAPVSEPVAVSSSVPETVPVSNPAPIPDPVPEAVPVSNPAPVPDPAPEAASKPSTGSSPKPVSAPVPPLKPIPVPVAAARDQEPRILPPELEIVAEYDGKELAGAKLKTMNGVFELPYRWERPLSQGRSLGPYKVVYERGGEYLTGEFRVTVDWHGLKTIKVKLKRSDRERQGGIQSWAF